VPRKQGMSRSDVLETNVAVANGVVDATVKHAPNALLLMVTNPVDVLTYAAWRRTGWSRHRVFGMAGVLDSARMASFVAMETGFSVKDISAMVLGGHGDTMVPMTRFTTINGISVEHFLTREQIDRIVERTRQGGAEILALRKTGSAYDAPAAAIASMVDAISRNRKHILPAVAVLDGEYGLNDICMGVPVVFGEGGMERVIQLPMTAQEADEFRRSSEHVRADLAKLTPAS
jgi:malate dehydrogenase